MKNWISILAVCLIWFGTGSAIVAQTKKDGSKDMRFKANKKHLKKDGTADKRYKANK